MLDYFFFLKESDELGILNFDDFCDTSSDFFYSPYLFFRETYFTAIHYQFIYAYSALWSSLPTENTSLPFPKHAAR